MDRDRALVVGAGVVALVVGLVALRGLGVLPGRGPEVVLLGDSITYQTADTFTDRLGGDWEVIASGIPGFRADQRLEDVPGLAAEGPVQVVINLGTNDVVQRVDPAATVAALEELGRGFPHARCVHLVTVTELLVNPEDPGLAARAADLNARIRDLAARHGWGVVPWDAILREDVVPGAEPPAEGPLTSDTIHPTERGEQVLADAYGEALAGC